MAQALTVRQLKDVPALRQIFSLMLVAAAVAAGIAVFTWAQKPEYSPLFSGISDKDSAEMAEALRAAGIEHQYNTGSGTLSVDAGKVQEARLKLATQGLPRGGAQGFELIQQEQGLGTSQLIEGARYQHALETELSRTIGALQPVASARVHLALPKPSAFARGNNSASASVLVELRGGRSLEAEQVASIVHLVASSVPGLAADAVSVVDQSGRLLTRAGLDSEMASAGEQYDYGRRIERDYVRRIEQLLAPLTGAGRVSAQVSAELDFSVTEEARESYNPNPQAVRSEQSTEASNGAATPAQGIPGATSNQPPAAAKAATPPGLAPAATSASTSQTRAMTRNYELDKTLSHKRQSGGSIRRLSVAVLVDHRPKADDKGQITLVPLSTEELAKVESLVKEAVGFNAQRGDSVSVQNSAFLQPESLTPPVPLALWEKPEVRDLARSALGTFTLLALFFTVLRPLLKSVLSAPVSLPAPAASAAAITAQISEDRLSLSAPSGQPHYEEKLQAARAAVTQDPKRVAQVVKNWVGSEQ